MTASSIFPAGHERQNARSVRRRSYSLVAVSSPPMTEARPDLDQQSFPPSDSIDAPRGARRDVWIGIALLLLALTLPPLLAWLVLYL